MCLLHLAPFSAGVESKMTEAGAGGGKGRDPREIGYCKGGVSDRQEVVREGGDTTKRRKMRVTTTAPR